MSYGQRRWAVIAGCVLLPPAAWLVLASNILLAGLGVFSHPRVSLWDHLWGWPKYLPYFNARLDVTLWVVLSAGFATIFVGFVTACVLRILWRRAGGFRGMGHRLGIGRIQRSTSNNHGQADWMSDERAADLFPPHPHPEIGGVVVGEIGRDDLTPEHERPFKPKDPTTWGMQGKTQLMFDHCERGTTHSMVIGGGGAYKSTTLSTTLLYWKRSLVVQDPAGELAEKVGADLERQCKRVICLDLGMEGPNILEAVDLKTEKGRLRANTRIQSIVSRVMGPMPKEDGTSAARFKSFGRSIVIAVTADLVFRGADPSSPDYVPPELVTMRTVRAALDLPSERMRDVLRGIYEASPSKLARGMASNIMDQPDDTWGGSLTNAKDDTSWLITDAYADLVSGNAFKMRDLAKGNLAVFQQIPQEVLEVTPALARCLIGSMLDAVFAQRGVVVGRVGFFIDEAVLLGNDPSLKIARDQGRKFKVTLQLFYQSEAQVEEVWGSRGKDGKDAWFDGLSFRSYTRIQNVNTAKDLVAAIGTYGVITHTKGHSDGSSGRPMEMPSSQRGSSTQEGEAAREVVKVHELLQEMRANERITLVPNSRPLRHKSAIDFCRRDVRERLGQTAYQQQYGEDSLEDVEL